MHLCNCLQFDESDSDEDLADKTKDGLIDQVRILQHQLQEQKKENSRLRKLIRCSESMYFTRKCCSLRLCCTFFFIIMIPLEIPELEVIVRNLENRLKGMAGDTYVS